eukprot:scaffold33523_cov112-Isochrysis_galbana.AAC.3
MRLSAATAADRGHYSRHGARPPLGDRQQRRWHAKTQRQSAPHWRTGIGIEKRSVPRTIAGHGRAATAWVRAEAVRPSRTYCYVHDTTQTRRIGRKAAVSDLPPAWTQQYLPLLYLHPVMFEWQRQRREGLQCVTAARPLDRDIAASRTLAG